MKVISYSIWGNKPKYLAGLLNNYKMWEENFSDMELWIYHDSSIPSNYLDRMPKARHIKKEDSIDTSGTFWRFTAIDEADEVWVRDADAILKVRNRILADLWYTTGKSFANFREHPFPRNVPYDRLLIRASTFNIMGCMNGQMQQFIDEYAASNNTTIYGCDEFFLGRVIYPHFENDMAIFIRDKKWQDHYNGYHKFDNKQYIETPETSDAERCGILENWHQIHLR